MNLEIRSIKRSQIKSDLMTLTFDEVDVSGRKIRYVATGEQSVARTRTLLTKEPLTVPWLETFKPGEVFVDIGANVGMYSIYAGAKGARVFSFEPESLNYAELNKNIFVNGLHGQITAYCMAMSNEVDVSVLYLSGFGTAWAHHDFGENRWDGDKKIGSVTFSRDKRPQQGCVSFTLDDLISRGKIPAPDHIKIDVDGFEWKVIKGAQAALRAPQLKTVLLEVDFAIPESVALIAEMEAMGWHYSPDQVRLNQHVIMPFEKIESLKQRGKGGANYIFFKDDAFYMDFFKKFADSFVPPNPLS